MATRRYQRLTIAQQRQELRRRREAQFPMRTFRCRHCMYIVDDKSREGHLGRCPQLVAKGVTFARGAPFEEHFVEEK